MGRHRLYTPEQAKDRQREQMKRWRVEHSKDYAAYQQSYRNRRQRFSPFRFWKRAWELIAQQIEKETARAARRKLHDQTRDARRDKEQLRLKRLAGGAKAKLIAGGGKAGKGLVGFLYLKIREQGFKCAYCLTGFVGNEYEIDHKTPLSRGGTNAHDNLHFVCNSCNKTKFRKTDLEYRETLTRLPRITSGKIDVESAQEMQQRKFIERMTKKSSGR